MGEWDGDGGVGGGGGWEAIGGLKQTFKQKWQWCAIRHNSSGRPGLLSQSVWHPMQSY